MNKNIETFLALYKTYEGLLREHGTDYRTVEEKQTTGRMTMMRQMRNYLSHADDQGFIMISDKCIVALENMIKEEKLKGDIVKNHLVTPAKGSIKEGMLLSGIIRWMSTRAMLGYQELPVYDPETKRLKGIILLEWAAYMLDTKGNLPLSEDKVGTYGKVMASHILKPDDPMPENMGTDWYFCTKDGTLDSQYLGYVDNPKSGRKVFMD